MPNIRRIESVPLEFVLPPEKAYGMSRGLNYRRSCTLVLIETDGGILGCGEAMGPVTALREYVALLTPFFVGRSIFDFEIVAARVTNTLYHFGVQNHLTAALSGISIALTDAIGKTLGVPAHDLLGGRGGDRFPCYATTGYLTPDPENSFESQLAHAAAGKFAGVKIKIGVNPASDLERVRTARRILGDDVLLMVDINGNYTPDIALETLRRIAPFNIHWCEEPLPPTDIRGYAELRARSPIPLSAGEACHTVQDFKRLVEARGIDILQPSITSCGGFGQARAIALLAAMNNLRLSPSVWGTAVAIAAAIHFTASLPVMPHSDNIPYPVLIEFDVGDNPLRERLLKTPLQRREGQLLIPAGAGLGIELDGATLETYRIRS